MKLVSSSAYGWVKLSRRRKTIIDDTLHHTLNPVIKPFFQNHITVSSTDISNTYKELGFLEHLTKQISDLLDCRIDQVLKDMSCTALCVLPEAEPTSTKDFLADTEKTCKEACEQLSRYKEGELVTIFFN